MCHNMFSQYVLTHLFLFFLFILWQYKEEGTILAKLPSEVEGMSDSSVSLLATLLLFHDTLEPSSLFG
jgi:hypothetical protein